jgi:hypothetical protein
VTPPENTRDAALGALKRLIKEQKARLDPRLLEQVARAAVEARKPDAPPHEGTLPYDRAAAAEAIRIFLKNHPDGAAFETALRALLKSRSH